MCGLSTNLTRKKSKSNHLAKIKVDDGSGFWWEQTTLNPTRPNFDQSQIIWFFYTVHWSTVTFFSSNMCPKFFLQVSVGGYTGAGTPIGGSGNDKIKIFMPLLWLLFILFWLVLTNWIFTETDNQTRFLEILFAVFLSYSNTIQLSEWRQFPWTV